MVHGQGLEAGEGGGARGRQGYAWVSYDFDSWLAATAEAFALAEPAEAAERGVTKPYDQVHLGVAGTSLGNVVVGLYGLVFLILWKRWFPLPAFLVGFSWPLLVILLRALGAMWWERAKAA